jgi:uncharacterized protein (TIGR03435 family)
MSIIRWVIPALIGPAAIFGQSAPVPAEFEVASIRPAAALLAGGKLDLGVHIDGAQVRCNAFTLREYVGIAYRVKDYQVSGPEFMASERFDISAKLPAGAAREQVPQMLQALLTERFRMKMHRETREFPVYALVVAKGGLKMKESPPDADTDTGNAAKASVNVTASGSRAGATVNFGKGSYLTIANDQFEGKKLTMTALADSLARFVDRPTVDMTNLKGNYDFTLKFTPEDFRAMMIRSAIAAGVQLPAEAMRALEGVSGDSLFTALQTLGLKLEPRKAPLEVLVIDHTEKAPSEN